MNDWIIPKDMQCPSCKGGADSFTATGERRLPAPGDLTICFYCGAINVYKVKTWNHLKLEELPESSLLELKSQDPEAYYRIARVRNYILSMKND